MKATLYQKSKYLPYSLKYVSMIQGWGDNREKKHQRIKTMNIKNIEFVDNIILRPLKDLKNKIFVNNEFIDPINEIRKILIKIDGSHGDFDFYEEFQIENYGVKFKNRFQFHKLNPGVQGLPFHIVEKLIEWHFDIYDLINQGKAIDVNSLKK